MYTTDCSNKKFNSSMNLSWVAFLLFIILLIPSLSNAQCHSGEGMRANWADSYTDGKGQCHCINSGKHARDHGSEKFWDQWCNKAKLKEIAKKLRLLQKDMLSYYHPNKTTQKKLFKKGLIKRRY